MFLLIRLKLIISGSLAWDGGSSEGVWAVCAREGSAACNGRARCGGECWDGNSSKLE